ncbi:hypothetical protein UA08_08246 [Talaromyces atroroseus]|uniref:GPI-anchored cell surface glycoprotein n=1 Tax=Talaromyces atroroseus TaxID=1441469 RepID=A0A225ANH1_TALAT|nr:hypothetical protein UA08_08246 [Talaromyces atroroseus]OKL56496.1 hypothetical protein UA08_08246 [Talaromyces atroroseus]
MAAHEDAQKSSSIPSTPQSFLYYETDSPFPQSNSEEAWPNSKRRRTQRTSSETQFIHMNGYKSDSQVGTRFNNTYVESYSDSKTFENGQNKPADAASTEEDAPVVESTSKVNNEDPSEPAPTKSTRSSRKPTERSTETSSRVLKVKSGTGSSQQTNIQTFIFKTKLDPRLAYRDRSDEPATPSSSTNENMEVKLESAPPAADTEIATATTTAATATEPPAKATRKTRKSEANMLKFKSYTPNATPILRNNGRKPSRQEQFVDVDSPSLTQRSPTSTVDDYDHPSFERGPEQEKQKSPEKTSQFETPSRGHTMADTIESNSTQRRSTRIRKPVNTTMLLGETPRKQKSSKEAASTPATQSAAKSAAINGSDHVSHASPSTPVPETGMLFHGSRDDMYSERFGTPPSPEGLSANTRTSGRLRKPTIKAIEALQSKPRSRKRLRDSDQFVSVAELSTTQGKSTPEPPSIANAASAVSMSRSTSDVGSEALSFLIEDADVLGRQLYALASSALKDLKSQPDNDQAKIDEWREAFNQRKSQEVSVAVATATTATANEEEEENIAVPAPVPAPEIVQNIEHINLPGEINDEFPLDHPDKPRPWTEEDGWTHTGRVNKYGEEYCLAPAGKYQWVKHASNYRTPVGPIPTPPPMIKSVDEIRRDNIYGFPPSPGTRNLYQRHPGQVWRHEKVDGLVGSGSLGLADTSGAGDAMNSDEPGRKTRYIHRKGLPRFKRPLKIVFVDSSKLKVEPAAASDKSALRKRRQSAPASGEANKPKSANKTAGTPGSRKRSLDMTGLNSAGNTDQAQHQQRKKRQSTTKTDDGKTTPARQKRHSTTITFTNLKGEGQPTTPATATGSGGHSLKATPKAHSLGTRMAHTEKLASKHYSGDVTAAAAHEVAATTPATTISGRARRRTMGVLKPGES